MKNQNSKISLVAMGAIIVGVVLYLLTDWPATVYIYGTGAIVFAVIRLRAVVVARADHSVITRLPQIQLLSAAVLVGGAYLMHTGSNSWSILLLLSAVLEIYVTYRQK